MDDFAEIQRTNFDRPKGGAPNEAPVSGHYAGDDEVYTLTPGFEDAIANNMSRP